MKRGWTCALLLSAACAEQPLQTAASSEAKPEVLVETPPPPKPQPVPMRPLASPPPMTVVRQADSQKPLVSFRFVFHAGSADDPPGKEGLTALAATVMKEGGTQDLSSSELLAALYPMAAELQVSSDVEMTVFSGRVHKDHLDRFLKIITDVLVAPRMDPKEFARLKQDALSGVKNYLRGEDDETLGKVALDALIYEGHPYAHWPVGTVAALQTITLDDVRAQAAQVFTKDRLVVGLAGPVDDALEKRVKDRLAALPATGRPLTPMPPAPGHTRRAWVLEKEAASTAISLGYAWDLRRGDPDFYPVAFALSYLGEHRQSNGVLYNELREKRGLNYGDYAYAEHFTQEGWSTLPSPNVARSGQIFSLWIRPVEPANALFAARSAVWFLDHFLKEGINAEGFDTTRGFLTGYTRLWEQTDQRRLGYAIDGLFYGTPDFLEGYRQAMTQMTPKSVLEAARRHLTPDKLNLVFVTRDAAGIAKALHAPGATPPSYANPKEADVVALDKTLSAQPFPVHPELVEVHSVAGFMER